MVFSVGNVMQTMIPTPTMFRRHAQGRSFDQRVVCLALIAVVLNLCHVLSTIVFEHSVLTVANALVVTVPTLSSTTSRITHSMNRKNRRVRQMITSSTWRKDLSVSSELKATNREPNRSGADAAVVRPPSPGAPSAPDVSNVKSYLEAVQMVDYLKQQLPRPTTTTMEDGDNKTSNSYKVIVMGGGLAGLSTAKHLVDAGHVPIVLEARTLLGGKIAAWRDEDGDVSETGLHVFFGAYPNALQLFDDLGISNRLQWKQHQMLFAKPGRPTREFAIFDFPSSLPAPLNAAWAIFTCADMLSWKEKILLGIGLIPAYIFGQRYVEEQEKVTVQEWLDQRGIPPSVSDEVFLAMSKALGFIGPEQLSMQCVLIALNRFLQETSGSRIAFLDGSPTERLCEPLKEYIEARGGMVRTDAPVKRILVNLDDDSSVAGLLLKGNEVVSGDVYVNAMPVDALKTLLPDPWRSRPYFSKLQSLRGVPVMNLHLWFDRKLSTVDNLIFSRSPLLSVYADMSETCAEYASTTTSMLELVFAPAAKYMTKSDDEILQVTLQELERLFPQEIQVDQTTSWAKLTKYTIVRTPTSVYTTVPGMEEARPTQVSPISNFFCAGDFSKQRYLASMEGAILSGKLAATAVANQWLLQQQKQEGQETCHERPARQLKERPRDETAPDANDVVPDRTLYVARRAATIPPEVKEELLTNSY